MRRLKSKKTKSPTPAPYATTLVTTDGTVSKQDTAVVWDGDTSITGSSVKITDALIEHVDDDGVLEFRNTYSSNVIFNMQRPVPITSGVAELDIALHSVFYIEKDQNVEIKIINSNPLLTEQAQHISLVILMEVINTGVIVTWDTSASGGALPLIFPQGRPPSITSPRVGEITRIIGSFQGTGVLISDGMNLFAPLVSQIRARRT